MIKTGRRWATYSMSVPEFDVRGYTEIGKEHQQDAVKAMQILSKLSGKPIPDDIQLEIESKSQ